MPHAPISRIQVRLNEGRKRSLPGFLLSFAKEAGTYDAAQATILRPLRWPC